MNLAQSLAAFRPELALSSGVVLLLLFRSLFSRRPALLPTLSHLTALLALTLFTWWSAFDTFTPALFGGMLTFGPFGAFFRTFIGAAAIATILLSWRSRDLEARDTGEYLALLLGLTLGASLFATASHLLMLYLAMEFLSIISYILTAFVRATPRSSEAGLKYAIYGGVASGIFLFGVSLFYGMTGTLSFETLAHALPAQSSSSIVTAVALLMMFVGFSYKIAAVPFHMWCPDAYEGAPAPFAACLSVLPKAAGFAALIRFLIAVIGIPSPLPPSSALPWPAVVAVISFVTMTLGNLTAIWQTNVKRLLAYSSIAHAGYILMGVAVANTLGIEAVLFSFIAYAVMNLGAFLVVILVENAWGTEEIGAYRGLGRRGGFGVLTALSMTVFLLSLTGIPPFVGFIGKFYLFSAVIEAKLYWLAIAGAVNSVISLFYYMRIVRAMFLEEPVSASPFSTRPLHAVALSIFAAATIILGLGWQPITLIAQNATVEFYDSLLSQTRVSGIAP